jgi:hypothetical protein
MIDGSRKLGDAEMKAEMTATNTAKKISPMLAVADMEETLASYHNVLGFTREPTRRTKQAAGA